ncbi:ribosome small subunit-dependent GTPase A [Schinkia azotoformans MEV2011]|uniref:Small ribosomal subunit biogenesis GTPase RsgA n=2 Tax=Schinkia azotoformans TaxID=1454 RepID=A0A072NG53_SCHAZ|nr:ribosome small subunit-dependent GTPase A [Schinkia azotoformans]KEF35913.1 ribosome small subunit-dependent GTPase A [Schinkia azotoformans MEV2011]MEC1696625.1 ribosome small subunit-dependent GTPase A [Schinkia azotoformans]MEC1718568.1 ribosome small subunit-dependent GTPase A [Schinkia azotoformans]MEC1727422.1 ribosome small subunit-dependent GTPase A [Schinkia azotoformans]MEC1743466.1 ribosome small subunit-dependent GTPase A [Schinkia azotoformans]
MNKIDMKNIGLTERFILEANQYKGFYIGRISSQSKNLYKVLTEKGEIKANISGKLRHSVIELSEYPAVGDFVMVDRVDNSDGNGIIHHVLTRKSVFARKVAGSTNDTQVVAANIDTVFICMSLNNDFNLRRLERYLSIAWDSGATPVIVLTKSDLCQEVKVRLNEISSIAFGVDVLVTTSISDDGYQPLKSYLFSGRTIAFIGSSGVGKSSLINRLLGQTILETKEIRNDDKGKHTTTRRELIMLPNLGVVIDTPGMRELGIISADLTKSFADITELASNCRFNDCTHQSEPNCAVQKAIKDGILSAERLESYRKLGRETKYDGLNSKMIEKEKINEMFSGMGGMKNARKFLKEQNRKKRR